MLNTGVLYLKILAVSQILCALKLLLPADLRIGKIKTAIDYKCPGYGT